MTTFEELDALPSGELHHRASRLALEHHDVRFFWQLLEAIPEAKALAAGTDAGEADIHSASSWLTDFVHGGGRLDDALRPVYTEYILEHE